MTHITAMKLALEALTNLHDEDMDYLTRNKLGGENNQRMVFAREAIAALQAALAEPSDPIVGTRSWYENGKLTTINLKHSEVYTHPPVPKFTAVPD
jgi:hypothetical protein